MAAEEKKVESQSKMIVALGSSSYIKKKVVEETFGVKNAEIIGLKFPSGVPEQPVGKEQTQKGAQYRADKAMELQPNAKIWVGIENGMYRDDTNKDKDEDDKDIQFKYWFDIGCIVIMYKNPENNELLKDVVWSDSLAIPIENTKLCLTLDGKAAKFDGNYTWSPLKDPHNELTQGKKPRKVWLLEAMQKWKETSIFK